MTKIFKLFKNFLAVSFQMFIAELQILNWFCIFSGSSRPVPRGCSLQFVWAPSGSLLLPWPQLLQVFLPHLLGHPACHWAVQPPPAIDAQQSTQQQPEQELWRTPWVLRGQHALVPDSLWIELRMILFCFQSKNLKGIYKLIQEYSFHYVTKQFILFTST